MVYKLNLENIKDNYRETFGGDDWQTAFANTTTETNKPLCSYCDEDEFYTDDLKYISVDEINELVEWDKVRNWIENEKLWDEFMYYASWQFEKAVRRGDGYTLFADETKEMYTDFAKENIQDYLEWLWK